MAETNGTPIAVNGRVYFNTRTDLLCLGDAKAKPAAVKYPPMPSETPYKENAIAGVRLFPAEITAKPGEEVKFQVVFVDENGREVKSNLPDPKHEWSIVTPAKTPTGAQPPPLAGKLDNGTLTLEKNPSQQGYVELRWPGLPPAPEFASPPWAQDDSTGAGGSPGGWVNTSGKYLSTRCPTAATYFQSE